MDIKEFWLDVLKQNKEKLHTYFHEKLLFVGIVVMSFLQLKNIFKQIVNILGNGMARLNG